MGSVASPLPFLFAGMMSFITGVHLLSILKIYDIDPALFLIFKWGRIMSSLMMFAAQLLNGRS